MDDSAPKPPKNRAIVNPWADLRRHTPARIALGRVGASLPTDETLKFGWDHAQARDAVHRPLDAEALGRALRERGWRTVTAASRAADRREYLVRPDLGRRLNQDSALAIATFALDERDFDLVFVAADGLSSLAVDRHVPDLLDAVSPLLPRRWRIGPLVIATQARVALGDEVGELLRAKMVVVMIGERPGLTSPDSLGLYITASPRVGLLDAARNCISNVRPAGLRVANAASKLAWILRAATERGLTGVGLKDESDTPRLESNRTAVRYDLSD